MKYLVLEVKRAYAIVLDEEGRFLKVANMNYEVGQELTSVVTMREPAKERGFLSRKALKWMASAAVFVLVFFGLWQFVFATYGTVRMQINPDVEVSVNRLELVTDLEGKNDDGKKLIQDYKSFGKKMDTVLDELADKAMAEGYLEDGGNIRLTVRSKSDRWKVATEERLIVNLDVRFEHKITVTTDDDDDEDDREPVEIIIPVRPADDADDDDDKAPTKPAPQTQPSAKQPPVRHDDDDDDEDDDRPGIPDDDDDDDTPGVPDDDDDDSPTPSVDDDNGSEDDDNGSDDDDNGSDDDDDDNGSDDDDDDDDDDDRG